MRADSERDDFGGPSDLGGESAFARAPSISLPTGGGAIRGIGEQLSVNPATGTGSLSIPLVISPGRSGFTPRSTVMSYDSSAGNGPLGFGWRIPAPAISRRTDLGLPRYRDDDRLTYAGQELVPLLVEDRGRWRREEPIEWVVDGVSYRVHRYRPRVEGAFARIEHWCNARDAADSRWRVISGDNVTSWYGKTPESCIADPEDKARIFSWLLCESHDDSGNAIAYGYKAEDSAGVDLALSHEHNRTDLGRCANRYLKRIRYGNRTPHLPTLDPTAPTDPLPTDWMFEVVFDYGEHDGDRPTPREDHPWPCRDDPFSTHRAGFERRTYRLCRRVLMFHHFGDEPGVGTDCLVRATATTRPPATRATPSIRS